MTFDRDGFFMASGASIAALAKWLNPDWPMDALVIGAWMAFIGSMAWSWLKSKVRR